LLEQESESLESESESELDFFFEFFSKEDEPFEKDSSKLIP
jgi:hypothetical protein